MKRLTTTRKFLKHYKARVSQKDDKIFQDVVDKLLKGQKLGRYRDHQLTGKLKDFRECHLKSDLLLIYQVFEDEIRLIDIGSHAQLFK